MMTVPVSEEETEDNLRAKLAVVEKRLAARFGVKPAEVEGYLVPRLKLGEIDEDTDTETWCYLVTALADY